MCYEECSNSRSAPDAVASMRYDTQHNIGEYIDGLEYIFNKFKLESMESGIGESMNLHTVLPFLRYS